MDNWEVGLLLKSVLLEQKTILIVVGAVLINLRRTFTSVLHTTTE